MGYHDVLMFLHSMFNARIVSERILTPVKLLCESAATSKLRTLDELEAGVQTLGFRGEALSSLSDISILEITSKVQGCPHTYYKIMKASFSKRY